MKDEQIEALLRRYRPIARLPLDGGRSSPEDPVQRLPLTWPWAVAAAALLAITVGIHAAVVAAPEPSQAVDAQRVQAITNDLGGTEESRVVAEWLARYQARAERDAQVARLVRGAETGRQ